MKYSKRFFSVVAMVLCFSLCVGTVSHADTIKYKETKLSSPIAGLKNARDAWLEINSTGKIQLNLYDYRTESDSKVSGKKCAYVTYSSSGKKQVKKSLTTENIVLGTLESNTDIA